MNKSKLLAALEGLLYVVGEDGLTIDQIVFVFEISDEEALDLVETLKTMYDKNLRGITIINTANKYKMATRNDFIDYYKKLFTDVNKSKLSGASLEVLSIVAYKQPITRAEIEDIRGTNSENVIRRLLAMSLVKEVGRLDTAGRPIIYGTTNDFLDYFNLSSIEELPELVQNLDTDDDIEKDLFNMITNNNKVN
ncbi:MAG: segregation and condensation protein [Haloplasmataceae bacterium]|nr:segregation and condensation protein [Haloplasmataceae bacterium]